MDNRQGRRLVPLGLFAALGLQLLLFAAAVRMGTVLVPFSDMYDLVARWLQYRDEAGGLLAYLLDPHNFHRLAYTRALVALDMGALHGSEIAYLVVGIVALAAAAALLARAAWTGAPHGLRLPAAAVAAMLVLSSVNALDVVFPINTPYVHAFVFAMAALVAWDSRWPWAALPLAILAALGNAVALVVWPVLFVSAWATGARSKTLIKLGAVGVAFIGLYAMGQTSPPRPPFDLMASLHYGLVWLGLPWSTRLGGPAIGLGLLALSLFVLATRGGPDASKLERLAVRLILFSLGAAAMAVLGRSGFEPDVPVRYALFLTPLHLGLFLLALPWIARRGPAPILAALIAVLLAQQAYGVAKVAGAAAQVRAALADFAAGRDTPMVRVFVHPDPARARAVLVRMRAQTGRDTTFAQ